MPPNPGERLPELGGVQVLCKIAGAAAVELLFTLRVQRGPAGSYSVGVAGTQKSWAPP